jgi:uncharacterized membrane protein YfhO
VHVYALRDPWPRAVVVARDGAETADPEARVHALDDGNDRVHLVVEAAAPAAVLLRDAWFAGWTATVNGQEAPVQRAEAFHKSVPIGPGRSHVTLRYRPPGLRAGLVLGALAGAAALTLLVRARRRPSPPPERLDQP